MLSDESANPTSPPSTMKEILYIFLNSKNNVTPKALKLLYKLSLNDLICSREYKKYDCKGLEIT